MGTTAHLQTYDLLTYLLTVRCLLFVISSSYLLIIIQYIHVLTIYCIQILTRLLTLYKCD